MPIANIILVVEAPADGQKIVDGAIVGFTPIQTSVHLPTVRFLH